jgi:diacylglycerol kinase (ATP)
VKVYVIYNPNAGLGTAQALLPTVLRKLREGNFPCEVYRTQARGDARIFASRCNVGEAIVCMGGDGTINEVINGLKSPQIPVLAIPTGTSNVLTGELKTTGGVDKILERLLYQKHRTWDLGIESNTKRKFALFASAGFDAEVVHTFDRQGRRVFPMVEYFMWGVFSMLNHKVKEITVEIDGKIVEQKAPLVMISNVSYYGGPLVFTPLSRPDDGYFDIIVVRRGTHRDLVRHLYYGILRYISGLNLKVKAIDHYRGKKIRLFPTKGEQIPLQVDGEPVGFLPTTIDIMPSSLKLI